uniref:Smr domain-containing protein n=1 Tax=Steinernema glaseri TaxID=37863 RepID=A0A1I8AAC7_9BILA
MVVVLVSETLSLLPRSSPHTARATASTVHPQERVQVPRECVSSLNYGYTDGLMTPGRLNHEVLVPEADEWTARQQLERKLEETVSEVARRRPGAALLLHDREVKKRAVRTKGQSVLNFLLSALQIDVSAGRMAHASEGMNDLRCVKCSGDKTKNRENLRAWLPRYLATSEDTDLFETGSHALVLRC